MNIEVDPKKSYVVVHGRATGHRFQTRFNGLSGSMHIADDLSNKTKGCLSVPMAKADAGDFLRTSQIKRFLAPKKYPETTFEICSLTITSGEALHESMEKNLQVEVEVRGMLRYRAQETSLTARARGTLSKEKGLRAQCRFKLDLRQLDIEPPSFLFLKVNSEVEIEVELSGA